MGRGGVAGRDELVIRIGESIDQLPARLVEEEDFPFPFLPFARGGFSFAGWAGAFPSLPLGMRLRDCLLACVRACGCGLQPRVGLALAWTARYAVVEGSSRDGCRREGLW